MQTTAAQGTASVNDFWATAPAEPKKKRAAAAAPKVATPPKRRRAAANVGSYKEASRRTKLRNDGSWTKDGVKTRAA